MVSALSIRSEEHPVSEVLRDTTRTPREEESTPLLRPLSHTTQTVVVSATGGFRSLPTLVPHSKSQRQH